MSELRGPMPDVIAAIAEDAGFQAAVGATDASGAFARFYPLHEPANEAMEIPYILYSDSVSMRPGFASLINDRVTFMIYDKSHLRASKVLMALYRLLSVEDKIDLTHSGVLVGDPDQNDSSQQYSFVYGRQRNSTQIPPVNDNEVSAYHCVFDLTVRMPQSVLD